jgi:hypothetical protein
MRLGLASDVHGNLVALEAVVADGRSNDVDAWWVLGDLIATGPDPDTTLELLTELPNVRFVRGNTDRYVVSRERQLRTLLMSSAIHRSCRSFSQSKLRFPGRANRSARKASSGCPHCRRRSASRLQTGRRSWASMRHHGPTTARASPRTSPMETSRRSSAAPMPTWSAAGTPISRRTDGQVGAARSTREVSATRSRRICVLPTRSSRPIVMVTRSHIGESRMTTMRCWNACGDRATLRPTTSRASNAVNRSATRPNDRGHLVSPAEHRKQMRPGGPARRGGRPPVPRAGGSRRR